MGGVACIIASRAMKALRNLCSGLGVATLVFAGTIAAIGQQSPPPGVDPCWTLIDPDPGVSSCQPAGPPLPNYCGGGVWCAWSPLCDNPWVPGGPKVQFCNCGGVCPPPPGGD